MSERPKEDLMLVAFVGIAGVILSLGVYGIAQYVEMMTKLP